MHRDGELSGIESCSTFDGGPDPDGEPGGER
jgi:hypothetical protein